MTIEYNRQAYEKVFDDLDKFRDYCRFEGRVFNEADLYKDESDVWQQYQRFLNRKPYLGKKSNKNFNNRNNNNFRKFQR